MAKKITGSAILSIFLSDYGARFCLREIARRLGKPHQSIKPHILSLVSGGILTEELRKRSNDYLLNMGSMLLTDALVIAEKERLAERLAESPLLELLFERISDFFPENIFILFGSAVDTDRKESDIDLLVFGEANIDYINEEFETLHHKPLHIVQVKSPSELGTTLALEVFKRHLIFNNTEKIIRYFLGLYEQNRVVLEKDGAAARFPELKPERRILSKRQGIIKRTR